MINQLKEELNFDFNNPSYKKLDEEYIEWEKGTPFKELVKYNC